MVYSFYVAKAISGSYFGKVRIFQFAEYGGVRVEHLINFEFWRLFTSQIIHMKQFHMLFNVLSFLILGIFIERQLGIMRLFILWFVAGAAGTIFSTYFGKPPFNLGTGASQAVMGVAAFGVLLSYQNIDASKGLKYALAFAIVPALFLDLIYAGYPKPGHVMSFIFGLGIGLFYIKNHHIRAKRCSTGIEE